MRSVVVIGGGVTGLAAAHRLHELAEEHGEPIDVRVLEASEHSGGLIRTTRRDGFILEHGPDSMITDKPWGQALAQRLGLGGELVGTQQEHRRSFVVCNGKLEPVPEGFQLLAPTRWDTLAASRIFSLPGKARMALDLVIPRRTDGADESLGEFVLRRLGREALERMAQPMIAGIYGADPMQLSLAATMPRFQEMEREHGSVIRGMLARSRSAAKATGSPADGKGVSGARYGLFVSFRQGMQTLIDGLVERVGESRLTVRAPVTALRRSGETWEIEVSGGETLQADGVILALPAPTAANLISPHHPQAADRLRSIPYADAGTMTLCYRTEDVPQRPQGFGFVVPAREGLTLLGCTFSDIKWPNRAPEGYALLRAFLGGDRAGDWEEPALLEKIRADYRRLMGITAEPLWVHSSFARQCMPHYVVGHLERMRELGEVMSGFPTLRLAGNAYAGVGVPDSVHSGEQAAEAMVAALPGQ